MLPKFAITTGLLHGDLPTCLMLTDLIEVELVLIIIARVIKHMITYTAGGGTSIK